MQSDYILRIIEQFIQAIVAIVQRRKAGNYKEAYELIQKTSRYYLKTDIELLLHYSPDQIINLFRDSTNHLDAPLCICCADLLQELALINEAMKQDKEASRIKSTCLCLYKTAVLENKDCQTSENFEKISILERELNCNNSSNYD